MSRTFASATVRVLAVIIFTVVAQTQLAYSLFVHTVCDIQPKSARNFVN